MKYCMIPTLFGIILLGFLDFFQKPPDGSTLVARWHIRCRLCSWYWYEPPGGATLFAFFLLFAFCAGVIGTSNCDIVYDVMC